MDVQTLTFVAVLQIIDSLQRLAWPQNILAWVLTLGPACAYGLGFLAYLVFDSAIAASVLFLCSLALLTWSFIRQGKNVTRATVASYIINCCFIVVAIPSIFAVHIFKQVDKALDVQAQFDRIMSDWVKTFDLKGPPER
jgi:hypothetical protein